MRDFNAEVAGWVEKHSRESVRLLQDLIRTPSPSGQERACAERLAEAMRSAGFAEVRVDDKSDALGVLKGVAGGRSLLFNGHIDHVPPADMAEPYSGLITDGSPFGSAGEVVYGRAACDMKAAVAAAVMAGAALRDLGVELRGDYKVAGVALEEVGGAGTIHTMEKEGFLGDVVLIGEATGMDLALGHRGSAKTSVTVTGRSCHASAPERGVNAVYKAADLLQAVRGRLIPSLPSDPRYGRTSLAVTSVEVKPGTLNVVPYECTLHMDCRNTPDYPGDRLREDLENLIKTQASADPEFKAAVAQPQRAPGARAFTGFYTDPERHPEVGQAEETIAGVLGRTPRRKTWAFATDGRMYSWRGLPVLGFGPGEERFAHTAQDHVRVADYLDSIRVYAALAARFAGVEP